MTHEEAFALMMDALDGTLTPAGQNQLDAHLVLCSSCYAEWQSLQYVEELLTNAPVVAAPAGFGQRLQDQLEMAPWRRTLGALFALSAASLVVLAIVTIPAVLILLGIWTVYNDPSSFTQWLVWLNQMLGVSGSLMDVLWTTMKLFLAQVAANPVVRGWALAAALAVAVWAHMTREAAPIPVVNGYR